MSSITIPAAGSSRRKGAYSATRPVHLDVRQSTILSVSPIAEDHRAIERIFSEWGFEPAPRAAWRLVRSASLAEATGTLKANCYPVVLCERDLNPGDWRDLLRSTFELPDPPAIVVTSRHADDHLWAEALNLGAYDVLTKPFERCEVMRVLDSACSWWGRQRGCLGLNSREASKPA